MLNKDESVLTAYLSNGPVKDFEPVLQADEKELDAAKSPLTVADKKAILNFLGFQSRGKDTWYHPILGPDTVLARMSFSCADEEPYMLVNRIYKLGINEAKTQITAGVKSLFNL